ncbi:hypothetical protein NUU61_000001 [Penicillium alfredii]|uniref:Lysine-specific metallo-endopeptidase domain-containing protein n=1 Tax=Penicillium alfredii TaxID=1506179 RepID=A0A9W9KQI2_9EURO|nr:uncharacterized protein NUU61_000001 [Penicillium alfredii]KAJ5114242.1 hypothetical protein NUU61_000001 [Penicillium alfredii]
MRLSFILALVHWLSPLLAWGSPDLVKLDKLFWSLPSGHTGSCMDHDMETIIQEASIHINKAGYLLNFLMNGRVKNSQLSINALNLASEYFGIDYEEEDDCVLAITWGLDAENRLDVKGLYIAKSLSPQKDGVYQYQKVKFATGGPKAGPDTKYCVSTTGGEMTTASVTQLPRLLVLCKKLFTLKTLPQAREEAEKLMKTNDPYIDDCETRASHLVHELMHMVNSRIVDVPVRENGVIKSVYGPAMCKKLARQKFDETWGRKATDNADNYRLFALGATFKNVNWWPQGYAVNVEGESDN